MSTDNKSITEQIAADAIAAHEAKHNPPAEPVPVTPSDYQKLYEEKSAEVDTLNAVIAASRVATNTPAGKSFKPVITADRLRAMVGDLAYHKMPRKDKIVALGGDPATSDEVLKKAFGRGNDGVFANDLHRSDPRKYSLYR